MALYLKFSANLFICSFSSKDFTSCPGYYISQSRQFYCVAQEARHLSMYHPSCQSVLFCRPVGIRVFAAIADYRYFQETLRLVRSKFHLTQIPILVHSSIYRLYPCHDNRNRHTHLPQLHRNIHIFRRHSTIRPIR